MSSATIVTNNPLVERKLSEKYDVRYIEQSYLALLERVRDLVHTGALVLTHPQAGSIKPGETPYRTVMVQLPKAPTKPDIESLALIESAIEGYKKFPQRTHEFREGSLEDFQMVDYSLIQGAIDSATQCHS
ncbi:MAG: GrdX family protein [Atopobiaceae bacterium]|jgi:hypothetical protein